MGLIRAAQDAVTGVLADQWKEYFYCDALGSDILMHRGQKRVNGNNNGRDNIISNGSVIAVADGQCMLVVDQGKVVEMCAEPGEFIFDTSSEPSIFAGHLGESVIQIFKTALGRFTYAGDTGKDQRVYYINTTEIRGNLYGTASPIPFRVVDKNIGLDMDLSVRCHGEYSYIIENPLLFYKNICANVSGDFTRDKIDGMMKTELVTALQPALAGVSAMGVRYSELPAHAADIADALNEQLSKKWRELRGIAVYSFGIAPITLSPEDQNIIKELQKTAVLRDPTMAAATVTGAQAEAMKTAAANTGGAMLGFMGMNMAQQTGGINAQGLYQMGAANKPAPQPPEPTGSGSEWVCSCGAKNSGKFCVECGKPRPDGWLCSCGTLNKGKFCMECGKPKPAGEPLYKCDKCGWEPEDPKNPPKFCPRCGDPFNDEDVK